MFMSFGIFGIVFLFIIGVFIFIIVKGLSEWNKNNISPRLTVDASIVTKRSNVSHDSFNDTSTSNVSGFTSTTSTTYYVTFQVESGDRIELRVSGSDYGMLAEGDHGRLSFQGTRYLGFERV